MSEAVPLRRRWFRFSLRTLLALIVLLAIPLAWIAKERRQSRYEQQIAQQLTKLGCEIWLGGPYDARELMQWAPETPAGWQSRLARQILGERIYLVRAGSNKFAEFDQLADLKNVRWIHVSRGSVTDLAPLSGLTSLNLLSLNNMPLHDLKPLAGLADLKSMSLQNTHVEDLTPLAGLNKLEYLSLHGTPVTKEQIETLQKALPDCKIGHYPFP